MGNEIFIRMPEGSGSVDRSDDSHPANTADLLRRYQAALEVPEEDFRRLLPADPTDVSDQA